MGQADLSSTFLKPCNASQGYVQCNKVLDLPDYKNLYLQTAKEYVDKMFVSLDQLSNNTADKEALNNLHICSHSLKSQSQVMSFTDIANICLSIEKISDQALKGNGALNSEVIVNIKSSVEKVEEMLKPHFAEASRGKQVQDDKGVTV